MRSGIATAGQTKPTFIEAARRAQIIDCAIDAIADLGFGQASLAQIAKRASISTGVILYHFASKEELLRSVVAHVYAIGDAFIRPRVDARTTAREALHSFIEGCVQFLAAHPNHARALIAIARGGHSDDQPLIDRTVTRPRRAGLQAILEWGQRTGEFRPFAIGVMITTITGALDAATLQLARDPATDLVAHARELVELFDRATRADPREKKLR